MSENGSEREGAAGRRSLVAICNCGGWIMVAALGYGAKSDDESFRNAGKLAARGFDVRTMPHADFCALEMCQRAASCISPRPAPDPAQEALGLE